MAATPEWYRCQIVKGGPADDGNVYLFLRDTGGAFEQWFTVSDQKREILATALAALSAEKPVDALIPSKEPYSPLLRLYLLNK